MIKNVIFDFDGTIANTLPTVVSILNDNKEKFGIDGIEPFEVEKFRDFDIKYILKEFKIHTFQIPFIVKAIMTELTKRMSGVEMFLGFDEVFKGIKRRGLVQGVVTTNYVKNVTDLLSDYQETELLFIRSESSLFGKHNLIKKVMKEYALKQEETIYIGDEIRDIEASRKAGVRVISVSWGYNSRDILEKYKPDYLVDSPSAILQILDTINK